MDEARASRIDCRSMVLMVLRALQVEPWELGRRPMGAVVGGGGSAAGEMGLVLETPFGAVDEYAGRIGRVVRSF